MLGGAWERKEEGAGEGTWARRDETTRPRSLLVLTTKSARSRRPRDPDPSSAPFYHPPPPPPQLTDAREAAVAHAEARLLAARARHASRADVERALLGVLSARDAGSAGASPRAALATREARVRALLTPPSAADWDASDPGAAAALAAGVGAAVADLSRLRVRLTVGPAAAGGAPVSLATMLTWSADMFAATYGAAGASCAALLAAPLAAAVPPPRSAGVAAATLYREMRCFTKAWAAAHPASIHTALSLVGFTDASGATFLADGPSPPIEPHDTDPPNSRAPKSPP